MLLAPRIVEQMDYTECLAVEASLEQRKPRPSSEPSGLLLARGGLHGIEVLSPVNRSTPIHPVSTCQMLLISQETPRLPAVQSQKHFLKEAAVLSGRNMR